MAAARKAKQSAAEREEMKDFIVDDYNPDEEDGDWKPGKRRCEESSGSEEVYVHSDELDDDEEDESEEDDDAHDTAKASKRRKGVKKRPASKAADTAVTQHRALRSHAAKLPIRKSVAKQARRPKVQGSAAVRKRPAAER
eukprot:gnl/TRDRNA2_/TRDRNA2_80723_c0_seq1.p1 gnl/TRDRNA2_/TRDRNA2_80723_c0~~gnl/TRDRNA2_/TRDRNA2_80723_c0_seq1.p1  ORF type:complete len:140 (-),score=38.79 gnl/TRDRNA2_/TRDRNA2_80723_c0_seq1:44-463(-)